MAQWVRLEVKNTTDALGVEVIRRAFDVVGTTAKGAWLRVGTAKKWVHAEAQNAYASPTDEIALARLRVQQDARRAAAGDEHRQSLVVDALARIACGMAQDDEPEGDAGNIVMRLTDAGMAYVTEAMMARLALMDEEPAAA